MEVLDIEVERRVTLGSSAMKQLRKRGIIPAVVYGHGGEASPLEFGSLYYHRVMSGRPATQLFKFKSKDTDLNGQLALLKDIQIEPLKDVILHIDFVSVRADEKVTISVPLKLVGEAAVVKQGDAILSHATHEIEVECLPTEIPAFIEIDISGLTLGHSIHASDIVLPANVELVSDPELSIVSATVKREEEATPVTTAAAAPADAAAAAPAGAATAGAAAKEGEK